MKPNKKQTYCPWLWEAVYIEEAGNVYTCCHHKPKIIGNIYHEKLIDIYNNQIIQELRQEALEGRLKCFKGCNLPIFENYVHSYDTLTINYSDMRQLHLMFGEACNINCIMCWQRSGNRKFLDYDKLIENVDITPFTNIILQGGEPLFIEPAKSFFNYVIAKNKKAWFATNGTLISDDWAEKIARFSPKVSFSLNAATKSTHELVNKGSRWDKVLQNIRKVIAMREKYNTEVKIVGHMTIVLQNIDEIPLFISNFRQFGFDLINFGYDISKNRRVITYLKKHPFKKIALKRKIRAAIPTSYINQQAEKENVVKTGD